MARNRTISPKLWMNPKLCRMSPVSRLLHVGLISLADDAGNLIAEPFVLWQQLFAGDGVTDEAAVRAALDELVSANLVERYETDGVDYVHHPNFERHQQMNRRYSALYPLAPGQEYERTPTATKVSASDDSGRSEPRQLRLKSGPSDAELAAYALLDACWEVISKLVSVAQTQTTWKQRNKRAALDLLASGKDHASILATLQVALTHPDAKPYYGNMNRLDKLAEAWPKLEAFARNPRGGGRRTFERLGPPDEAAS